MNKMPKIKWISRFAYDHKNGNDVQIILYVILSVILGESVSNKIGCNEAEGGEIIEITFEK